MREILCCLNRRGTSWAKVKEMEEAARSLLRAASMKTPSATSPSECSRETSPEVMSPGQMHYEGHSCSCIFAVILVDDSCSVTINFIHSSLFSTS